MCAYKINLQLFDPPANKIDTSVGKQVVLRPARYIPKDQDYINATTSYQGHDRFYYPVVPDETGDLLIFANKTANIGINATFSMAMQFEPDTSKNYLKWNYAAMQPPYFFKMSNNKDTIQPEMIEVSQAEVKKGCNVTAGNCALMISIRGESKVEAYARLRVFTGANKLRFEKPIIDKLAGKGNFKYYWFLSTGAKNAAKTKAYWQHMIALGIKTSGADFDLYVTVMDGRYPVENDFDFSSTNYGADSIQLSSNNPIFMKTNPDSWDPTVGMVVVVGVKSLQDSEAQFSLVVNGPNVPEYNSTQIGINSPQIFSVKSDSKRSVQNPHINILKWYNWGHGNFKLEVKALKGPATFYISTLSESEYLDNAYSGIALNN